ncbi:phosphoribosyltransferase domain-containing protein [Cobetia crustatorum]|uniref:Phosphoribosyltransferase n=1 Tax=Cobetia crustatorum TaxID=553385 RepID=A0A558HLP2_9GAMM|nr:phosphoribosyltransferase domain-containing protein [Cobetia crustatorum]TVU69998.1 hypothetical protein FQP86_09265 [Cobetia crustatorum]
MTAQTLTQHITAGRLDLTLTEGTERLDELLTFASRLNPRRGYLFVSRVLGKHVPVDPRKMDQVHAELAQKITLAGDSAYVVGMAETAVGLGAGVARHLGRLHCDCIYQHTTRFLVPKPWLRIREAHSHADTMHMAHLSQEAAAHVAKATDLVLVDDEISTGLTLAQLASELVGQEVLANITRLHIVSLVSWLTDDARARLLEALPGHLDVHFVQLMAGTFTFTPDPGYHAVLPADVDTDFCDVLIREHRSTSTMPLEQDGLFGKRMNHDADPLPEALQTRLEQCGDPATTGPVVIYGMGEFLDAPFRLALAMSHAGHDVRFQSSTRSPIAIGDGIASHLEIPALGQPEKRHFLYNADATRHPMAFEGVEAPRYSVALEDAHLAQPQQADTAHLPTETV